MSGVALPTRNGNGAGSGRVPVSGVEKSQCHSSGRLLWKDWVRSSLAGGPPWSLPSPLLPRRGASTWCWNQSTFVENRCRSSPRFASPPLLGATGSDGPGEGRPRLLASCSMPQSRPRARGRPDGRASRAPNSSSRLARSKEGPSAARGPNPASSRASGVARATCGPGNPAFPPISAPVRPPRPLFPTSIGPLVRVSNCSPKMSESPRARARSSGGPGVGGGNL